MKISIIGVTVEKPKEDFEGLKLNENSWNVFTQTEFGTMTEAMEFVGRTLRDNENVRIIWEKIEKEISLDTLKKLE